MLTSYDRPSPVGGIRSSGFVIVDILLAIAISATLVATLSLGSNSARDIYTSAKHRAEMIDLFENGQATSSKRLYGNKQIETDYPHFTKVSLRNEQQTVFPASGNKLCAVDFGVKNGSTTIRNINLPVPSGLPLTHLEVINDLIFVSADSAVLADPDLYVFRFDIDSSTDQNASFVSAINTGPGLVTFVLAGNNIFAAAASSAAQLHIISLDANYNPSLVKKYQLPLPYATATPPFGSAVSYQNNLVYLGTEKWVGDELAVIDVSNTSSPTKISGLKIGNKVDHILTNGNNAYVSAAGMGQFRVIDISNLTGVFVTQTFSPSGWNRQEGKVADIFEDKLAFGRTSGGYDINIDHELFAWPETASTTLTSPSSRNLPGGIYGIVQDRNNLFVASRETGKELQIFTSSSSLKIFLPTSPQDLTCDGNKLFVLSKTAPTIYEISFNK